MKKTKLKKNSLDIFFYILLVLIIVLSGVNYFNFRNIPISQFMVIVSGVAAYLAWALIYHHLKNDLTLRSYLEYMLIASLVLAASMFIFLR